MFFDAQLQRQLYLLHKSNVRPQPLEVQAIDRAFVQCDFRSCIWEIPSLQQTEDCALSTAAGPHKRRGLVRGKIQIQALQYGNVCARRIGKPQIPQLNVPLEAKKLSALNR